MGPQHLGAHADLIFNECDEVEAARVGTAHFFLTKVAFQQALKLTATTHGQTETRPVGFTCRRPQTRRARLPFVGH